MTDTETANAPEGTEAEGGWDPGAANAWEEALIADLRANGGRPSTGPLAGNPLLLLFTKGAKSGQRRRSILTYSRDGADYIVAGSKSGATTHPAWFFNLQADPDVTIEAANETFGATARVEQGAERDRLWANHVAQFPGFGEYPALAGGRVIPMIRLSRKG